MEPQPELEKQPKSYSKYDMIKVKVHIEDHFYVLSRYLISRHLRMIAIPEPDCIKISMKIKKSILPEKEISHENL